MAINGNKGKKRIKWELYKVYNILNFSDLIRFTNEESTEYH